VKQWALVMAGLVVVLSAVTLGLLRRYGIPLFSRVALQSTVQTVLEDTGPEAEARLQRRFERAGASYPPDQVAMVVLKAERRLELWARNGRDWRLIERYPILAASGRAGPKLREGDRQVPEGVYRIESLNPNSSYHLSMKLNYPNQFDRLRAREDGRERPGSDIFIHGGSASVGCVAVGNPAIEELFCVVARLWPANVEVVMCPCDMRSGAESAAAAPPEWYPELCGDIRQALERYKPAP
jgi:murein L,D-transpeptidase YafK